MSTGQQPNNLSGCGRNCSRLKRFGVCWCLSAVCTVLNNSLGAWEHLESAVGPAISECVSSVARLAASGLQLPAASWMLLCQPTLTMGCIVA